MKKQLNKKRNGFTIVELIVVMAIIAVLILIAVPTLNKYLDDANNTADLGTANTIYKSAMASATSESVAGPIKVNGTAAERKAVLDKLNSAITEGAQNVKGDITVDTYKTESLTTTTAPAANDKWQVLFFEESTTGVIDPSGTIYIVSPKDGDESTLYENGVPLK